MDNIDPQKPLHLLLSFVNLLKIECVNGVCLLVVWPVKQTWIKNINLKKKKLVENVPDEKKELVNMQFVV